VKPIEITTTTNDRKREKPYYSPHKGRGKTAKEYIYKLFADEEDVFLFWNGRKEDTTNIALPFHSIEHIDEPRKEAAKEGDAYSMFDTRGRQLKGWTNKLIWGDNKLILSSLANGPMRQEIEAQGGLKLIYIDPPFAVGADFGFNIEIGGETAEKTQSVIEEIAYRDTWGKGLSSYLTMMYDRLKLMHNLLADDGYIAVHVGDKVAALIKILLSDIFGENNYRNTIIIPRGTKNVQSQFDSLKALSVGHDYGFLFSKNENTRLRKLSLPGTEFSSGKWDTFWRGTDRPTMRYDLFGINPSKGQWRWSKERAYKAVDAYKEFLANYSNQKTLDEYYLENEENEIEINFLRLGPDNTVQYYVSPRDYKLASTNWHSVKTKGFETNYATEKNEELLQVFIDWITNEGDLIADFFCGSGTTAAVAEKLGRKWITTDLGRFAVHTARKRLIGVQRELQSAGKDFRAFEMLNLGKYERQFFMDDLVNGARQKKEDLYVNLILEAYKAKRIEGHATLHGSKAGRFVHVGPLDVPVTQSRLLEIFEECRQKLYTQVDVLGFEFEMGLTPQFIQELKEKGVSITLKYIPKEVFDKRAVEKGQVKFFDVAYLNTKETIKGKSVTVTLTDFVTHYTQDDIEDIQQQMRAGSKVVIEDGQIIKLEKSKDGIINRTLLTKNWYDWIDYWAIDFNYEDRKEIIKIKNDQGETEEVWRGNYLFENEWQSFRTKKNPTFEFTSIPHLYDKPGKYKIMVKVVDILGIDTSKIVPVNI